MNELYFLGMDIVEEIKNMINISTIICTNDMTENELKAYKLGVKNVLSALKSVVQDDNMLVVNIKGLEIPTELSIDELEGYYVSI